MAEMPEKRSGAVLFVGGTRSGKSDMALRFAEGVWAVPEGAAPAFSGAAVSSAAASALALVMPKDGMSAASAPKGIKPKGTASEDSASGPTAQAMVPDASIPTSTPYPLTRLFIATALVRDAETRARMERHQAQRGIGWRTVEEPFAVLNALQQAVGQAGVVVVDCIPFWLCNLYEQGLTGPEILDKVKAVAAWLRAAPLPVAVVSAEVGQGIVPVSALGRAYRDVAGEANQLLAAACPTVVLVSCGLPLALKGCIPKEVL